MEELTKIINNLIQARLISLKDIISDDKKSIDVKKLFDALYKKGVIPASALEELDNIFDCSSLSSSACKKIV